MSHHPQDLVPRALRLGACACLILLAAGCGGSSGEPAGSMEESDWEVRVESPLDSIQVTGPGAEEPLSDPGLDASSEGEAAKVSLSRIVPIPSWGINESSPVAGAGHWSAP